MPNERYGHCLSKGMQKKFVAKVVWSQPFVKVRFFFAAFPKKALFASAENLFFLLFAKCCHLEHNQHNDLKLTRDVHGFPKFL